MKFLKIIWKLLNSRLLGYAIIILVSIFIVGTCKRIATLNEESDMKDQNIIALNDTIKKERLKSGALEFSINGYIANKKELEEFNKNLSDIVNAQKGRVITLGKIVFRLTNDSTQLANRLDELTKKLNEPIQLNDSTWNLGWTTGYKNIGTISGNSIIGVKADQKWLKDIKLSNEDIIISNIDIPVELIWGQKWLTENGKKRLKVFAQTNYPGFDVKLLEGVYVDYPTKKHWFTGFGVGPSLNMGYDFINNRPAFILGVGIHYNVYNW